MSNTPVGTEPKCPGCNGPWRIIDQKCLQCMKRYHWYRYSTEQGLREQYEEYMREKRVGTDKL